MRISDWSSDVCSSDLPRRVGLSASRCSTLNGWRSANRRERLTVSRPFQGGIPPALSALCLWDARRGEMAVVKLITKRVEKPWGRRTLWPAFDDVMNCGEPVGEIWFQMPDGSEPELLVKYLFTSENLSIQVHPDDEGAKARGYPRGKDEAWVVLEADPGATIAIGTRRVMTREELREIGRASGRERVCQYG